MKPGYVQCLHVKANAELLDLHRSAAVCLPRLEPNVVLPGSAQRSREATASGPTGHSNLGLKNMACHGYMPLASLSRMASPPGSACTSRASSPEHSPTRSPRIPSPRDQRRVYSKQSAAAASAVAAHPRRHDARTKTWPPCCVSDVSMLPPCCIAKPTSQNSKKSFQRRNIRHPEPETLPQRDQASPQLTICVVEPTSSTEEALEPSASASKRTVRRSISALDVDLLHCLADCPIMPSTSEPLPGFGDLDISTPPEPAPVKGPSRGDRALQRMMILTRSSLLVIDEASAEQPSVQRTPSVLAANPIGVERYEASLSRTQSKLDQLKADTYAATGRLVQADTYGQVTGRTTGRLGANNAESSSRARIVSFDD